MRRRALGVAVLILSFAPAAHASTLLGQTSASSLGCIPNDAAQTAVGGGPDYTVPYDGVLTSWSYYNVDGTPAGSALHLKVWRPVSGSTYQIVAAPDDQPVAPGLNTFGIRVPVQQGDVLGYHADNLSPCFFNTADPGDSFSWTLDSTDPGVGATEDLSINTNGFTRLNVAAVLEPDVDGDGYGDDTQDACPNDPNGHDAATCDQPPVLSALSFKGATACIGGNDVSLAFSVTNSDDPADADSGTIDWGDGSTSSFTSSLVDTTHRYSAPGAYAVTVNVADDDGAAGAPESGTVNLRYAMSPILQPVNSDASSVFARRRGSTVPVKVRVTDCTGTPVAGLAPAIGVSQDSALAEGDPVNEVASTSAADTTGVMRYDGGQYIYNLSTTGLAPGTWTVYVREPTSGQSRATFALR